MEAIRPKVEAITSQMAALPNMVSSGNRQEAFSASSEGVTMAGAPAGSGSDLEGAAFIRQTGFTKGKAVEHSRTPKPGGRRRGRLRWRASVLKCGCPPPLWTSATRGLTLVRASKLSNIAITRRDLEAAEP